MEHDGMQQNAMERNGMQQKWHGMKCNLQECEYSNGKEYNVR